MTSSIKVRSLHQADYTEIKILIAHPMENGRNRDPLTKALIPAHFIQQLELSLNDTIVVTANLGGSVSKHPFFTFRLRNTEVGDRLSVTWRDNLGASDSMEHMIE